MDHVIVFVRELPQGHDFLLIEEPDRVIVAYREGAICPEVLMDSWAAYRTMRRRALLSVAV
jgi:hypothetical protein